MADTPTTRYTKSGDIHIAYQVVGRGPVDLVLVPGFVSHLEYQWQGSHSSRMLGRLASFSRLIMFDKPGTGMSDRLAAIPTLARMRDACGHRTIHGGARRTRCAGCSSGASVSGAGLEGIEMWSPSEANNEEYRRFFANYRRMSASPGAAVSMMRMTTEIGTARGEGSDAHHPSHRRSDLQGRPSSLPGRARAWGEACRELPGDDHAPWVGDCGTIMDEMEEFLTGVRPEHGSDKERVLATVLFTDIVGSTERAAALGDRRWRELLEQYYVVARRELSRFRGRADVRSTAPVTEYSRHSMARHVRSDARAGSATRFGRSGSAFGAACTSASVR